MVEEGRGGRQEPEEKLRRESKGTKISLEGQQRWKLLLGKHSLLEPEQQLDIVMERLEQLCGTTPKRLAFSQLSSSDPR